MRIQLHRFLWEISDTARNPWWYNNQWIYYLGLDFNYFLENQSCLFREKFLNGNSRNHFLRKFISLDLGRELSYLFEILSFFSKSNCQPYEFLDLTDIIENGKLRDFFTTFRRIGRDPWEWRNLEHSLIWRNRLDNRFFSGFSKKPSWINAYP